MAVLSDIRAFVEIADSLDRNTFNREAPGRLASLNSIIQDSSTDEKVSEVAVELRSQLRAIQALVEDDDLPSVATGSQVRRAHTPFADSVTRTVSPHLTQRRRGSVETAQDTPTTQPTQKAKRSEVLQKTGKIRSLYDEALKYLKQEFRENREACKIFGLGSAGYFIGYMMLAHPAAGLIGAIALPILFD